MSASRILSTYRRARDGSNHMCGFPSMSGRPSVATTTGVPLLALRSSGSTHLSRSSPLVITSFASDIRFASSGRGSYSSTCAPAGTIEPTVTRSCATCFAMSARIVVVVRTCGVPPPTKPHAMTGTVASTTSRTVASLGISSPHHENESQSHNENHTRKRGTEEYAVGYGTSSDATDGPRKADHLPRQAPHETAGHR